MTSTQEPEKKAGTDADLLAALRGADDALRAQEIAKLKLTIEWSLRHQVEPDDPNGDEPPRCTSTRSSPATAWGSTTGRS